MIATLLASVNLGIILAAIIVSAILIAQRKMLRGRDEEDNPPQ